MERNNIACTLDSGERVASIYADTYFNDNYCEYKKPKNEVVETTEAQQDVLSADDEWKSPSDLLIGIIDLIPPFTSKITRGKTHEGILAIGNDILEREQARFLQYMSKLMRENDVAWGHILEHEKKVVAKKVKEIYNDILMTKCKTMMKEINSFYESTLHDLEDHLRKEVTEVLVSAHANIISDMNVEIKEKLEQEKKILEKVLKQKYECEVKKIKHYYKLILDNENHRNNKLINQALHERNDAIKAFYRQIEAEKITSTMYMMCTERKKCKIKQFILDNYHSAEIAEKRKIIKERQDIIDAFKEREKKVSDINKEWEEKIKKILQLFLKFISFSLKLLPEQSTFLLDLEKMVVLQLNEIQKSPTKATSILLDADEEMNAFKFEEIVPKDTVCEKPFEIIGDTTESIPTPHGSRETLASNVDLPMIRLGRKFIYAKCDRFEEVKALLEAQRCKCMDRLRKPESAHTSDEPSPHTATPPPVAESESSNEPMIMDDIQILQDCPVRTCHDWSKRESFPYLNSYLDFTEENYIKVKSILGKLPKKDEAPELIKAKDIIWQELPFAPTREKYHHVGTQYSSQEDITAQITCPCTEEITAKLNVTPIRIKESPSKEIDQIMMRRKNSLQRVIHDHPNLLKMFTDESFDFIYNIK